MATLSPLETSHNGDFAKYPITSLHFFPYMLQDQEQAWGRISLPTSIRSALPITVSLHILSFRGLNAAPLDDGSGRALPADWKSRLNSPVI